MDFNMTLVYLYTMYLDHFLCSPLLSVVSLSSLTSPSPSPKYSFFCFHLLKKSLDFTYDRKHVDIHLSESGLFHLTSCFQFHSSFCKWHNFILLYDWIIVWCVYKPHFLHLFICCWAPTLIPWFHCLAFWLSVCLYGWLLSFHWSPFPLYGATRVSRFSLIFSWFCRVLLSKFSKLYYTRISSGPFKMDSSNRSMASKF
jgi:hypothetical protein